MRRKDKPLSFDTRVVDYYTLGQYREEGAAPDAPKVSRGDVGIELEVEGKIIRPDTKAFFWEEHEEGSLRGEHTEFVLSKPVPIDMLHQAVVELQKHTDKCKFTEDSPRTSVHIHVNVQRYTARELYSVLMCYWAFENILVRMNGPLREGNLFCLRQTDAEGLFRNLLDQIRDKQIFFRDTDGRRRYAALNLSSLGKFGSLEFRFIKGLTDFNEIEDWARALYEFCEHARRLSWEDVIKLFHYDRGAYRLNTVEQFFSQKFLAKMREHVTPDFILSSMQENLDNIYMFFKALKRAEKSLAVIRFPAEDEDNEPDEVYMDRFGRTYTRPAHTDDEEWAQFVLGHHLVPRDQFVPVPPRRRTEAQPVAPRWAQPGALLNAGDVFAPAPNLEPAAELRFQDIPVNEDLPDE